MWWPDSFISKVAGSVSPSPTVPVSTIANWSRPATTAPRPCGSTPTAPTSSPLPTRSSRSGKPANPRPGPALSEVEDEDVGGGSGTADRHEGLAVLVGQDEVVVFGGAVEVAGAAGGAQAGFAGCGAGDPG